MPSGWYKVHAGKPLKGETDMKMDFKKPTTRLVAAGLLTGCILLLTVSVPIAIPNMAGAYVNPGDVGVYVAAYLLGTPWGVLAAAAGSALADLYYGSVLYIGPTFIIKGLMAFTATKLLRRWNKLPALLCAGILMPIGYFIFETVYYTIVAGGALNAGAATAMLGVLPNLAQYVFGVVVGLLLIKVLERFTIKA
jgi:uncharacterized membrane protein